LCVAPPVPVAKVNSKAQQKILKLTVEDGEHVLLFHACKYGNNKHKKKYSTVVRRCLWRDEGREGG
jgi:hypothetical protein